MLLSTTPRLPRFIVFCFSRHYTRIYPILSPYTQGSPVFPTVTHPLLYYSCNIIKTARTLCVSPYRECGFWCPVVGCAFPDYYIVNYYNRVKNRGVFIKLLIFRRLSQKIVASALICKSKH
nr:MAG TPA: hypothetical protein [Herelleviridae sp.]